MAIDRIKSQIPLGLAIPIALIVACGGQEQTDGQASDGTVTNSSDALFASEFVAEHNRVRASVTAPPNYVGTWAPLPFVVWSSTVAASAQAWANHLRDVNNCTLAQDTSTSYGENLAYGSVGFGPKQTVALWEQEEADYAYSPSYSPVAGHYTQLIWRESTQIGCATAVCSTGWKVMVCRYSPAGNVIGAQPY